MNGEVVTGIRVRLQRRWRRVRGTERGHVFSPLRAYQAFIKSEPFCAALSERLVAFHSPSTSDVESVSEGQGVWQSDTEEDAAGFALALLSHLVEMGDPERASRALMMMGIAARSDDKNHFAVEHYLEPLFEYLDEKLDDHAELLASLIRFQQWARWFGHRELAALVEEEADAVTKGERQRQQSEDRLQAALYEWLFRDGMSFTEMDREPQTGVGRPDFKFMLHGQVVATEVKLFGDFGATKYTKGDLRKGVNQLLGYMDDYNAAVGYLVVFNREPAGVRCRLEGHHDGVPKLQVAGNRTVYVLVVPAIAPPSASRGSATQPVELTAEDLLPEAPAATEG
jgi:hypothetical protein